MSTDTKPTILFVPGSFGPPSIYTSVIAHVRSAGYPSLALQLPSTTKRMPLPPATMSDDADVIRRAVQTLASQGKRVVVVCHSYGGTPTSQALAGLEGEVARVVYLSAIVPRVGETQLEALGMAELPMGEVGGYMHIDPVAMAAYIANDLPWDIAYDKALNFAHHSAASFTEKVTQIAYDKIPVSYIVCEKDLVVSPEAQRGFIKMVEEVSAKEVSVVSLQSGHLPNWSMPERLAEVLMGEAERE